MQEERENAQGKIGFGRMRRLDSKPSQQQHEAMVVHVDEGRSLPAVLLEPAAVLLGPDTAETDPTDATGHTELLPPSPLGRAFGSAMPVNRRGGPGSTAAPAAVAAPRSAQKWCWAWIPKRVPSRPAGTAWPHGFGGKGVDLAESGHLR